jgi:hypothetical protein
MLRVIQNKLSLKKCMNNKSNKYTRLRLKREKKSFLRKKDKSKLQNKKKLRRSKRLIR